jgi:hypothetical protein
MEDVIDYRTIYDIISAKSADDLQKKINKALRKGFLPQGGVSSIVSEYRDYRNNNNALREIAPKTIIYSQAVIYREKIKKNISKNI